MCTKQQNKIQENLGAVIATVEKGGKVEINQFASVNKDSQLRNILNCLLDTPIDDESELDKSVYDISDKLDFNNIIGEWLEIITEEFFLFESTINETFKNSVDGIPPKGKFLLQMKRYYRNAKIELGLSESLQNEIKQNSSLILDKVFEYIYSFLESKNEIYEHFDVGNIKILVAFGFIECKILEKPKG